MSSYPVNRREFLGLTTATVAGGVLGLGRSASAGAGHDGWDAAKPLVHPGKALIVQPVLMYAVAQKRPATSWKSWGGVQTDQAAAAEAEKIASELKLLDLPVEVLPVLKVKSVAEAAQVHAKDYDAVVVYAASGSGDLLKACFAPKKDRDTIVFVRHRSGTTYYWYEALSTKYLQTGRPEPGRNSYLDHGACPRGRCGGRSLRRPGSGGSGPSTRSRISSARVSSPWAARGANTRPTPRKSPATNTGSTSSTFRMTRSPRASRRPARTRDTVAAAQRWAEAYLALPQTTLTTTKEFVTNAFVLYRLLKDVMQEHDASACTIHNCMSTIMPLAQTTPCLTLSLLNDEGLMAFCESDFVVIPAGVLLRHVAGTPVFLHNSTFPHDGIVTCAHCSSTRRLDGNRYEPATIVTHFESDYGAATKVEMPIGQKVTFLDPQYATGRWLGLHGRREGQPLLRDLPLAAGRRDPGRLEEAARRSPRLPLDDGLRRPREAPRLRRPQTRHPVGGFVVDARPVALARKRRHSHQDVDCGEASTSWYAVFQIEVKI